MYTRTPCKNQSLDASQSSDVYFNQTKLIHKQGASMKNRFILTEYIDKAMAEAIYDKLEDDSYCGRIPHLKGVIAFGKTLRECEDELHSTLEDWILVGLKLGHKLPLIENINLNRIDKILPQNQKWKKHAQLAAV